jgi:hypothetical protein
MSRILSSLKQRKIKLKEIKFYYAGQKTKKQFLSGIASANFEIFALIVNKKGRKIADTLENFAILIIDLINEIDLWYNKKEQEFYDLIKENIIVEKIISWPELKRKSIV